MAIRFKIKNKKIFKLYIFFVYFTAALILVTLFLDKFNNYDVLIKKIKEKNLKSIQLLTGRFAFYNWELGEVGINNLGEEPFRDCPEKRCYAFKTYSQTPVEKSDGIMVHGPNLWFMPSRSSYKRNRKQLWLFYTMEPQGLTFCSSHYKLTDLDDWFNLTATFKLDSDIYVDYKQFRNWNDIIHDIEYVKEFKKLLNKSSNNPISTITDLTVKNNYFDETFLKLTNENSEKFLTDYYKITKKASVVAFISHCETYSRREIYINELLKYINVDVYGDCKNYFKNSKKDPCGSKKNYNCINKILNKYKFYLSFENSLCEDYITEKYWKLYDSTTIFDVNIIPVVRGAREHQYKRETPNLSYINTYNFDSARSLADYLNFLDRNNTAYLQYFNWKTVLYKKIEFFILNNLE